jgi:hypothetical protein
MTHVPLTRICFIHSWWKKPKKRLLEGFNVFLFLPSVFPYILPFEPNFRMVKPCKSPTVDGFYQHFASIHAGQSASKIRMLVDVNPFKSISIHIYIYVGVCFRLKTCRKTWKIPRFSQHFPLFPRPGAAPGLRSAGASADAVGPVLFGARSGRRLKWGNVWDPWGKCDESGWSMVNLWLIYG